MDIKQLIELINDMTLEEKIGQMVQLPSTMLTDGGLITGPDGDVELTEEMRGLVGSILGKHGAEALNELQKEFMEKHPHHIPLLMMKDVINGMETIFPIPLAQGCTFSAEMVETAAQIAAAEASVTGLHVTFSPMVDLVRDARWGRVMESTGEDPWLNGELGKAMVRGYQGRPFGGEGHVAACFKHFAAYGAPEGGRDYGNVEVSERSLREDYLLAYRATVEENCKMAMTSFNTWNRIPATGNKWLMRDVLREEMGFDGVVISDWMAVQELVEQGIAANVKEAAKLAIEAGVDIDMASPCYVGALAELVRCGEVDERLIDESVMRILRLKNELGLFENPYRYASAEKEKSLLLCREHRETARRMAEASFVLLKNDDILPLKQESNPKLAFIGPYVDNNAIYGTWSFPTYKEKIATIQECMKVRDTDVTFAKGCLVMDEDQHTRYFQTEAYRDANVEEMMDAAVEAARKADKVVMFLGEHKDQSGECGSRTEIRIPKNQMTLLHKVREVNDNIVTVVFSGRPLEMKEVVELSRAVMMVWMPGTEGANAILNVLFGDAVPEGKLAMSLPKSVGQVPIFYNCFRTGRPYKQNTPFVHGYIDEDISPLYPFGYGMSYTTFTYSKIELSKASMRRDEMIIAKVTISNTGKYAGTETAQMYLHDVKASVVRPVKMLRGVKKVYLQPGESKEVAFEITEDMLRFYNINMDFVSEMGEFYVYIGGDSDTENMSVFHLI